MSQATIKNRYELLLIAVLAGFTPIILKYISRDQQALVELFNWSYLWTGLIMSVLGYIACYLSGELGRMKLFALAISAPALFSNMAGETETAQAATDTSQASAANPITAVSRYFGEKNYYSVSIFSSRSFTPASNLASAINAKHPELEAHVGTRKIDDEYYSVIIGSAQERDAARELATLSDKLLIDSPTEGKKGFWLDENQKSWLKIYKSQDCRGSTGC